MVPALAPEPKRARAAAYAVGLAAGLAGAAIMLTGPAIDGSGGLWAHPGRDLAQNLTGHLAGQAGPLRWPLLVSPRLDWPLGLSTAMTDSNPAATMAGMALSRVAGGGPRNLLGVFLLLCWLLQPVAAVYALRGAWALGRSAPDRVRCPTVRCPTEAVVAAALLSLMVPALIARFAHVNLLAHFTLLAALGLSARMLVRPGGWAAAAALQAETILIHPYLFVFNAAVLFAPVLGRATGLRGAARAAAGFAAATGGPMLLFRLLSGGFGGWDWGFGYYSMNLLSPVWPQRSGLFGRALPVLDATGGQYEGFNYLGAGALALIALNLVVRRKQGAWRRGWPLAAVLSGLTLLALTPRVYAGSWLVVPLGTWPWDQVFGAVRASGRAFWPVGYALVTWSVVGLAARLPRRWLLPVLAGAVLLQAIDTDQVRRDAAGYYAGGDRTQPAVPSLPAGLTLLRIVPACPFNGPQGGVPDLLRLRAVQLGAAVADMRASRPPTGFSCEAADARALSTPLTAGEVRVVLDGLAAPPGPDVLGPGAACRRDAGASVCANLP